MCVVLSLVRQPLFLCEFMIVPLKLEHPARETMLIVSDGSCVGLLINSES